MPPDNERRPAEAERHRILPARTISEYLTSVGIDRAAIENLVDLAINSGAVIAFLPADLVIVPDTMLLEGEANGHPFSPTTLLRRKDGRTAALYRMPEVGDGE